MFLLKVQKNISLAKHTTFKIGGPARYFFIAKNKEDLIKAVKTARKFKLPFIILGKGSNILFSDKGYKGLVIKIQSSKLKVQSHNLKVKTIYAESGVKLKELVKLAAKESLTGLEWAAGIPGTVGGAVYGNAGAFDVVMADVIESVEVLDSKNLKVKKFSKKDCKFSQKDTVFKNRKNLIILSAIFRLKKENKKEIQEKIKKYLNYRRKNHPLSFSSAGCAFKNYKGMIKKTKLLKEFPELKEFNKNKVIPAAFLIEKCGLKGKKIVGAQISTKHANFIVNLGRARAKDVIKLIKLARQRVKKKFGVNLEEEVQIIIY